jgi:hypothetical protein
MADTKAAQHTALELLEEDDEFEVCSDVRRRRRGMSLSLN